MALPLVLGGIALAAVGYGLNEYCSKEGCFSQKDNIDNKKNEDMDLDREIEELGDLIDVADEFGDILDIIDEKLNDGLDKIEALVDGNMDPDEKVNERKEEARKKLIRGVLDEFKKSL